MTILRTLTYSKDGLYLNHPGDQPIATAAFQTLLEFLKKENMSTFNEIARAPLLAVEVSSTSLFIQGIPEFRLNATSIQKFLQPGVPPPQSEPSIQSSFSFF